MIARIRRADTGEPTGGIHRTYLLDDGRPAKEEMGGRHKMALGPAQLEGGVVMLAPMTADGRLGVAEGTETSAAMIEINRRATGELFPIWATLRDWGMANFPFPPGLKQLLIFADGGKAGVAAAEKLQGRALAAGIDASYYLPKSGDDFARDLELRLWEQNSGEGEPATLSQKGGPPLQPEPQLLGTPQDQNLADTPNLDQGLNLDQRLNDTKFEPPAWSTSAGPIPPQTLEHILAAAANLTRDVSPEATQLILFILRGVALARLDSIGERQALDAIKAKTRLPIDDLRRQVVGFRREIGLAVKPAIPPTGEEIRRRYVFVKALDAFWDRQTRTIVKLSAVRHAHQSAMPPDDEDHPMDPLRIILDGYLGEQAVTDKVDAISFRPGADAIFDEDGGTALNIWTPPSVIAVPGDVQSFLDHLWYLLDGDKEGINYLLDVFAHQIQHPEIKLKSAILIIGKPGIGKSIIAEMLSHLVGERNVTTVERNDLMNPFNEWMDGVQLVIVNELMSVDRQETMDRLKSYITDPWLRINRKNVPTYRYRNRANFLMFSNREDAARIEKDDRRYFVWICKVEPQKDAYYTRLVEWFHNGGDAALLHFLQTRPLDGFNPNAAPAVTEGKKQVISDTRPAAESYCKKRSTPASHRSNTIS